MSLPLSRASPARPRPPLGAARWPHRPRAPQAASHAARRTSCSSRTNCWKNPAARVPAPWAHQVLFYGVFAAAARLRPPIVPRPPGPELLHVPDAQPTDVPVPATPPRDDTDESPVARKRVPSVRHAFVPEPTAAPPAPGRPRRAFKRPILRGRRGRGQVTGRGGGSLPVPPVPSRAFTCAQKAAKSPRRLRSTSWTTARSSSR